MGKLFITKKFYRKKILVIDDGSHVYNDVYGALQKFCEYVSLGSYFVVEDGVISRLGMNRKYKGGPKKAIKKFLNENNQFEVDRDMCDFFGKNATFSPDGFLKKTS